MLKRSLVSTLVGLNLVLSPAMAVTPTQGAPVKKTIDQKLPGTAPGAAFVNVKRIFSLYGDLIQKQSYYDEVRKAVADGCPDPAKDIDEVAFGLDLTKVTESNGVGGVVHGRFDLARALGFLAKKNITLTPSVHRGVALLTGKDGDESVQFGLADEGTLVFSSDKTGEHAAMKEVIATLNGEVTAYAEASGTTLPADYLALISTRIPAQIVDTLGPQVPPQFEAVTHVKAVSLSVMAQDSGDGSASLTATCDTAESATALTELLEGLRQNFAGSGVTGTDLLNKLTISVEGKNAKLLLSIKRSDLEEIFGK